MFVKRFLVNWRREDGQDQLFPMKQWLREHLDIVPPSIDLSSDTSHTIRRGLKRAGWNIEEYESEVHLSPPHGSAPPNSGASHSRASGISRPASTKNSTGKQVESLGTCFVIQPFDNGRFDKRYEDTFRPAIIAAGLKSYRVDQDPASLVPIEDIEAGIRRCDVCFAEISTDNPNVWFELGFAIAARKPVVMACSDDRTRFPFDVQHRSIIRYKSESPRDFQELGTQITKRLRAAIETHLQIESVEELSPAAPTGGLNQHELVALITIASLSLDGDPVSSYTLREEVQRADYTGVACAIAIHGLEKKQYIVRAQGYDGREAYWGFVATDAGLDWLASNQRFLKLRESFDAPPLDLDDENLPF